MRSVLLPVDLVARRAAVAPGTSLGDLADALAAELEPLCDAHARGALPVPAGKARLTRIGGRCPVHGALLAFDPWEPHRHRCARCGRHWRGADHDGWWLLGAHLWLMERAVHAAALHALRGEPRHAALARDILEAVADRYASWPNSDNVLGPSRPFFSTYLEAIWLLNACHALALLEAADPAAMRAAGARVRERLVAPSAALVAGFPEGRSNRQAWNAAALLAAGRLLDEPRPRQEARIAAWQRLVADGLLDDGSWYEGENYHLFAHRGLWYGVQQVEALGGTLPAPLRARFLAGFEAPFAGVLPDDTFPSRRDAPYAVSIRQWRIAEWAELGWAMGRSPVLAGLLTRLYDGQGPHAPDERAWSTADAERPTAASRLTRRSLSWRALLLADPAPPPVAPWRLASRLLPAQGVAVIRREQGRVAVALEGGHTGGGHGHPDQLALSLQRDADRWLEDPGAGSYTVRTLHWYRSTLAHHAPLFDGRSQAPAPATLLAWEDRGGAGWVWKRAEGLAPGVSADRAVVVCDGYAVDRLHWSADRPVTMTLPVAADAVVDPVPVWEPVARPGGGGLEDGFDFVGQPQRAAVSGMVHLVVPSPNAPGAGAAAHGWLLVPPGGALLRAWVPGPPGHPPRRRHWVEVPGTGGTLWSVWAWPVGEEAVPVVAVAVAGGDPDAVTVTTRDGTAATHQPAPHGWTIALAAGGARSSIDLEGLVPPPSPPDATRPAPDGASAPVVTVPRVVAPAGADPDAIRLPSASGLVVPLGEEHYIPTERPWGEAGAPTAEVALAVVAHEFVVIVDAHTGSVVPPDGAENPLDNERPEINADGLQWYLGAQATGWVQGGLALPAGDGGRQCRLVPGAWPLPAVRCQHTATGWRMRLAWPLAALPRDADGTVTFDLVVNERPPDRMRRRGQLVLSGGGGFGYLRGDRQDPAGAWRLRLPLDAASPG